MGRDGSRREDTNQFAPTRLCLCCRQRSFLHTAVRQLPPASSHDCQRSRTTGFMSGVSCDLHLNHFSHFIQWFLMLSAAQHRLLSLWNGRTFGWHASWPCPLHLFTVHGSASPRCVTCLCSNRTLDSLLPLTFPALFCILVGFQRLVQLAYPLYPFFLSWIANRRWFAGIGQASQGDPPKQPLRQRTVPLPTQLLLPARPPRLPLMLTGLSQTS